MNLFRAQLVYIFLFLLHVGSGFVLYCFVLYCVVLYFFAGAWLPPRALAHIPDVRGAQKNDCLGGSGGGVSDACLLKNDTQGSREFRMARTT